MDKEDNWEDQQLFNFGDLDKKKDKKGKKRKNKEKKFTKIKENFVGKEIYSYDNMYTRICEILTKNNPYSKEKTKFKVKNIEFEKVGGAKSKKYRWLNFKDFCDSMNRAPEHFCLFLKVELKLDPIIQGEKLFFDGKKLDESQIKNLSIKYINEYVKCSLCFEPKTILFKDQNTRKMVIKCKVCQSQKTLAQIS